MGIDTLITIGVVIYIIVSIRKALSHGKKKDGNEKLSGWRGKLKEMADQIKEEMEKANMEMKPETQHAGEDVPPSNDDDFYWDDDEGDDEELDLPESPSVIRERVYHEPPPVVRSLDDDAPEESHRNHPEAVPEVSCVKADDGMRNRFRKRNKEHLKQAVVWAEILDKPIGLRD